MSRRRALARAMKELPRHVVRCVPGLVEPYLHFAIALESGGVLVQSTELSFAVVAPAVRHERLDSSQIGGQSFVGELWVGFVVHELLFGQRGNGKSSKARLRPREHSCCSIVTAANESSDGRSLLLLGSVLAESTEPAVDRTSVGGCHGKNEEHADDAEHQHGDLRIALENSTQFAVNGVVDWVQKCE